MIDKIKNSIGLLDLAGRYGYHKGRNAAVYRGGDNPNSLLIEDDHWHDFKTGKGGDVIDFYAVINSVDNSTAIHQLATELGIKKKYVTNFSKQATEYHNALRPEDRRYLQKRGILDKTIDELQIGYCSKGHFKDRIVIPYWKNGYVVNFIARACGDSGPKYLKKKNDGQNQNVLWGLNTLNRKTDLIIVEGVFDALAVYQDGYKVLSPLGSRFSKKQFTDLLRVAKGHKGNIIISFDYDPDSRTGQKAAYDLAYKLFQSNIDCKIVELRGRNVKVDISDLYAQGQNVEDILADAVDFLRLYIEKASEEELYLLARKRDLLKYKDLIDKVLFRQLQKAPTEALIAEEIIQNRNLVFHDSLGWYEYNNGVWQSKSDSDIRSYVDGKLMRFSKGGIINSVLTVLQSRCNYSGEFNTFSEHINFQNGMLNIKTGKLQSHDLDYMSTNQLSYNYEPDANCPKWKQFISDVTDGDISRQNMLQEMFGYCLTGSTKYQKAFFLIGEGANGKSVLLKLLEVMLGDDNVAHVPLSGLTEDFQRVLLHNKNVNIVPELKSRLEGVNQYLKAIIDGETIQGAHKYRPHIQFRPCCKIICAGNEMFTSDDISHGFVRRLNFCRFPVRFEGDNRDLAIKDKLEQELPGILNWSLEGLRRLEEQGGFTKTSDQDEMLAKFKSFSDNTYDFIEEQGDFDFIPRLRLYEKYTSYCYSTGSKSLSSRKFYERIRHDEFIREKKIHGIDGFERKHMWVTQVEHEIR
jgi:P4 family phage/plasmid primase-like protien